MKRVLLVVAVALAPSIARAQNNPGSAPAAQPNPPAQSPPPYPYPPYPPAQYPYPPYPYPYPYAAPSNEPPKTLAYSEGQTIPPGYRLQAGPRRGMVLGGALSIAIPYLMGVPFAADSKFSNGSAFLLVPGIGPWITLAARNRSCTGTACDAEDHTVRFLLIFDGMAQSVGLALIVTGIAWHSQKLVRMDVAGVEFEPVALPGGFGAFAHASF